jgi:hypothetical protein
MVGELWSTCFEKFSYGKTGNLRRNRHEYLSFKVECQAYQLQSSRGAMIKSASTWKDKKKPASQ